MKNPEGPAPEVFVVAGCKAWNADVFGLGLQDLPGTWHFVSTPGELTVRALEDLGPRYVFFMHWSWKVPDEITRRWECVCFHMTDLPFGRGGSPLQNLISQGHQETVLTAFRMTAAIDAGPVYMKESLTLSGNAEEILVRASKTSAKMIRRIVADRPDPLPQEGDVVVFRRRTPDESELSEGLTELQALYDFVRMLDGAGYPRAFLRFGRFRIELSRASLYDGRIVADATITIAKDTSK